MKIYDVREAAERVGAAARFVHIDAESIERWADAVDPSRIRPAIRPPELLFRGRPPEIARWVLLLDALNFCFWTHDGVPWTVEHLGRTWGRYSALVASLHRAVQRDRSWLDPARWSRATRGEMLELFAGTGQIPMLDDRVRIVNETGRVLIERYQGEATHLAEAAQFEAPGVASLLADAFESFRDIPLYRGQPVAILKRAQICAADLAVAWASTGGPPMVQLERLTAFADYRVPQILRYMQILRLEPGFESRIEAGRLIAPSSEEEIELRACSILAVERMCIAVRARHQIAMPAWILDEYLWDRSHDAEVTLRHHLTLTWFY